MTSNKCPRCGAPKLAALKGNCPNCLIDLGALDRAAAGEDAPVSGAPLRRLGDYELLEEIARGGMGVVYRARQLSLNRSVAVKVLLAGEFANDTFIHRFRREAEAAASLNHPNIVSIHDVGEEAGRAYLSMELIEGRSLAEMARESPLPPTEAARLVKMIAEAVQFAHDRGVLHRDLKPSNVMVDAMGVPHITDFGLAKRVQEDAEITLTGQVLGTPNYMPPEQVDPKRGQASAASDVYSIGAILCQLLTGRAPFMAETVAQTLRLVLESEPISPRLLNPVVPRDLETICFKCLEKEPHRRYSSAGELGEELGRYLRDEPIRARPIGPAAKVIRWCRRKPALAAALMIAGTLLLIVAVGSPIAMWHIDRERRSAEKARKQEAVLRARAEHAELETQRQLYTALVGQAHASVQSRELGQRVRALDAIQRAAVISNSTELRREAVTALSLPDLRFEREWATTPEVTFVELDPFFQRVAMGRGTNAVEIRDLVDNRLIATLASASSNHMAHVAIWSGDGRWLAVKRDHDALGERADMEIWDVAHAERRLFFRDVSWGSVSFHPNHRRLLLGASGAGARIVELEDGREVNRFPLPDAPAHLKFSPDGARFAVVALPAHRAFEVVSVHDAGSGASLWANATLWTNAYKRAINGINWHPAGGWLAVSDFSGAVTMIDAGTGETRTLGQHKAEASTAEFSADGRYLFTGGWEREFICWDLQRLERVFTIATGGYKMQIRHDGRQCAIRTETALQLLSLEMPIQRDFAEDLGPRLRRANFSADGRWLAASAEKRGAVWDLRQGEPGALLPDAAGTSFFFTPDGRELFAGSGQRWRITPATNGATAPAVNPLPINKMEGVTSLCVSSNWVVLTGAAGSQVLTAEDLESGGDRWVHTASGMGRASPDGSWLGINGAFSPWLYVYALPGLKRVAKLTHPANIGGFRFSPCAEELAVYSSRVGVEFWSTATWQRTRLLTNFTQILIMPEQGGWWLTKDQGSASLYEPDTLKELLPLPAGMLPLAISDDGRQLAVSVDARRLQVWDLHKLRDHLRALGLDWRDHAPEIRMAQR